MTIEWIVSTALFPLVLEILKGLFLTAIACGIAWLISIEEPSFYMAGWQGMLVSFKRISFCLFLFLSIIALTATIRIFFLYNILYRQLTAG